MDESAVRDDSNQLLSEEFDDSWQLCFAKPITIVLHILVRLLATTRATLKRFGTAVHLGGLRYPGGTYEMKPLTRVHRVPSSLFGELGDGVINLEQRISVVYYLLDMG